MKFEEFELESSAIPKDTKSVRHIRRSICRNVVIMLDKLGLFTNYSDTEIAYTVSLITDSLSSLNHTMARLYSSALLKIYMAVKDCSTEITVLHPAVSVLYSVYTTILQIIRKENALKSSLLLKLDIDQIKNLADKTEKPELLYAVLDSITRIILNLSSFYNTTSTLVAFDLNDKPISMSAITPNPAKINKAEAYALAMGYVDPSKYIEAGIKLTGVTKDATSLILYEVSMVAEIESSISSLSAYCTTDMLSVYGGTFTLVPLLGLKEINNDASRENIDIALNSAIHTVSTIRRRIVSHKVTAQLSNIPAVASIDIYERHITGTSYKVMFVCKLLNGSQYLCFLNTDSESMSPTTLPEILGNLDPRLTHNIVKDLVKVMPTSLATSHGFVTTDTFLQSVCVELYCMLISSTPQIKSDDSYWIIRTYSKKELESSSQASVWFEDYLLDQIQDTKSTNESASRYTRETRYLEPYVRRLPIGQKPSQQALELAEYNGFKLKQGETVVHGFTKEVRVLANQQTALFN